MAKVYQVEEWYIELDVPDSFEPDEEFWDLCPMGQHVVSENTITIYGFESKSVAEKTAIQLNTYVESKTS